MTNREVVNRNLSLTFDFAKYLIDNQELINKLPDKFTIDFSDKDFIKFEKNDKSIKSSKGKLFRVKRTFEIS
jgi:hypothetical protein